MYSSGLPYSDEIYHHGIPGQKWGVRRFQNPDGSLTSEGRKRYSKSGGESKSIKSGTGGKGKEFVKGAAAVGMKAASRLGEGITRGVKTKLAEKMPFMLNDEELEKYRDRLRRENTFRNEMANRRELKRRSQGDQFAKKLVQDVAATSIKSIATKATNKIADELLKSADDKYKEQLDLEAKELKMEKERKEAEENKLSSRVNKAFNEALDIRNEMIDNAKQIDKKSEKIRDIMENSNNKPNAIDWKRINVLDNEIMKYNKKNNELTNDFINSLKAVDSQTGAYDRWLKAQKNNGGNLNKDELKKILREVLNETN